VRALAETTLDETERRAVEAAVRRLHEQLGRDLVSVWLYGSRARGERPHPESDVDMIVLVREADWRREHEVANAAWDAVEDVGANSGGFSILVYTPEWLRERREIDSFFIREVDRDKIVLYGDP
jgi:predicted nucleotidyltransferase